MQEKLKGLNDFFYRKFSQLITIIIVINLINGQL